MSGQLVCQVCARAGVPPFTAPPDKHGVGIMKEHLKRKHGIVLAVPLDYPKFVNEDEEERDRPR